MVNLKILVLLFFSFRCFSQGKTFVNCNYTFNVRFEKINSKDSILLILSFQNTSGKSIYLSDKIKTRWKTTMDYLGISLGADFSNEPPNNNYKYFYLSEGKTKEFRAIIEKSNADFFYVHLRGTYFVHKKRITKKQYSLSDFPIRDKRLIYYDFSENFYNYDR